MDIIDRRRDPGGRSLGNRQRFLRRARSLVRKAVREATATRRIREIGEGGSVAIPADGVHEPTFRTGRAGVGEHVLPGNREFVSGDRVPRPPPGGGRGTEGGQGGESEDSYSFVLTGEEFLEFFLADLELPNLAKRQLTGEASERRHRAGFQTSGPPASLSVPRTLGRSLVRRIALGRPSRAEIDRLRERVERLGSEDGDAPEAEEARRELARLERRARRVPFIDPVDLRFRRHETRPEPVARAVMFCLMDVSASMDERMKDVAKRFFALLYLFLRRRYGRVDIVFVRHTHEAREVDEETFFGSRESGGTVISSALTEMIRIVRERYPVDEWNIYAAQASDGDNFPHDNARAVELLRDPILGFSQFYAYIEIGRTGTEGEGGYTGPATALWEAYRRLAGRGMPFAMRRVGDRRDIYPVFRELFEPKADAEAAR